MKVFMYGLRRLSRVEVRIVYAYPSRIYVTCVVVVMYCVTGLRDTCILNDEYDMHTEY